MADDVRLWRIGSDDSLVPYTSARVALEEKLETWIVNDVSILSPDLMIIGRQVETAFGGAIDLLCLDSKGDTVIVELKRGKTPREVTAQVLDYASWVAGLSGEDIVRIANGYLPAAEPLDAAFKARFGTGLPEVLNESHRMLVVGSCLDGASERILEYLSSRHGVPINFAGFHYFGGPAGDHVLGRTFLIESEAAEARAPRKGSKRRPNLSYEQLEEIAAKNGVAEQYQALFGWLERAADGKSTTQSSVSFKANIDGGSKALFNLIPTDSSREKGLHFQVYTNVFAKRFRIPPEILQAHLPGDAAEWSYCDSTDPDSHGREGYFRQQDDARSFIDGVGALIGVDLADIEAVEDSAVE